LENNSSLKEAFYKTFSSLLFLLFFFLISSLPFLLNFRPFVSGIGVLCAPKNLFGKQIGPFLFEEGKCQKSPLYMLLLLWGFFYYQVIGFLTLIVFPKIKTFFMKRKMKDIANFWLSPSDFFILILILISTLLLIFPEFFYLKDIYPAHYRANTMFKLGYQAFIMLGIASGYIIFRIRQTYAIRNNLFYLFYKFFFIPLFSLVAIYPYFAINSYYGNLQTYHGLYGLNWLQNQFPTDYQAIIWLKENVNCPDVTEKECLNQPVVVEANGESYTDYARVSANTGLPTIVGWPVHEWLWRGSFDEAGKRIPEVANVYESKDLTQIKEVLKKYRVEYIFVGELERKKYKKLDEKNLEKIGKVVFQSGQTKIYKVKEEI